MKPPAPRGAVAVKNKRQIGGTLRLAAFVLDQIPEIKEKLPALLAGLVIITGR